MHQRWGCSWSQNDPPLLSLFSLRRLPCSVSQGRQEAWAVNVCEKLWRWTVLIIIYRYSVSLQVLHLDCRHERKAGHLSAGQTQVWPCDALISLLGCVHDCSVFVVLNSWAVCYTSQIQALSCPSWFALILHCLRASSKTNNLLFSLLALLLGNATNTLHHGGPAWILTVLVGRGIWSPLAL